MPLAQTVLTLPRDHSMKLASLMSAGLVYIGKRRIIQASVREIEITRLQPVMVV